MKETPILYSTDMIKAYLLGKKIMTRRVIKPQPERGVICKCPGDDKSFANFEMYQDAHKTGWIPIGKTFLCPYGKIGDELWVRETWAISSFSANFAKESQLQVAYKAGVKDIGHPEGMTHDLEWRTVDYETWRKYTQQKYYSWHSGRFMPRFASRITQTITEIRIERVNDISYTDCANEGFGSHSELVPAKEQFIKKWDELNAKRGYPFNSGCWVWVISYPAYKETK